MQVIRSFHQHTRDGWTHKLWKKKAIVAIENTWGLFSRLTKRTNLKEQYKGFRMYFNNSFASYKIISLRLKRSTEKLSKKSYRPGSKKLYGLFFSHNRLLLTPSNFLLGSKSFLGFYDASSEINSSTAKRFWKHKLWKKNIVPIENTQGHFSRLQNRTNLRKQYKWVQKVFWLFLCK